jgi:hypothetical protein
MAGNTCAKCGAPVEAGAIECPNCGTRVRPTGAGAITIKVSMGFLSGESTFEQDVITIGRPDPERGSSPDIDLSGDDAVSRFHAELRRRADGYYLVDLGSTNGTRLRGEEIAALTEVKLESGEEIGVGEKTRLAVQF